MKRTIVFIMLVTLLVIPVSTLAHDDADPQNDKRALSETQLSEKKAQREQALKTRQARKCEFVKERLELHVERIEGLVLIRTEKYQKLVDRLNVLALRVENNDGDATELRSAIQELSDLISQFEANYGQYIAEVRDAVNAACGEETVIKNIVGKALSAMRTAKADASDIKRYVNDELKPVLQELRATAQETPAGGEQTSENINQAEDN